MSRNRKSAKQAGARMEQAVADYLAWALNDRRVERRHLTGTKDRGDITGVMLDGERVCIEVKNTSRSDVSVHLAEAQTEAGNDDAVFWAVVQKRHGVGIDSPLKVGQQLVVMTLNQYATILNHGVPLGEEMES
jgi:hypothetical protein